MTETTVTTYYVYVGNDLDEVATFGAGRMLADDGTLTDITEDDWFDMLARAEADAPIRIYDTNHDFVCEA